MGWNHPDISLEEMMKLIEGFVDILVLAFGYQSSGLFLICSLAVHYIDFLADGEDLSMISLDHPLGGYCEEEINEFASWLGGSCATDVTKPLDGVLTIPLANGDNMNLHMSKKVHREFASKLFALYRNIRKAMERHEDLSQTLRRPAELIMGSFDGIKHDTDGFDKQGMRLLLATLNRIFDSL
ncbi:hypothetical protein GOBAR_DD27979 [Gossypium barbadense]|nr:hypothetical protein GOBAR_DD27979 [Gossypium barbadense]